MKNILSIIQSKLSGLAGDRRGQTMVEYALLAGFLAAAGGAVLGISGDNVATVYVDVAQTLETAATESGAPVADSPTPANDPSDPGDGDGSGGDSGGDNGGGDDGKKDKKDKSNNGDNGNGNKNGHYK